MTLFSLTHKEWNKIGKCRIYDLVWIRDILVDPTQHLWQNETQQGINVDSCCCQFLSNSQLNWRMIRQFILIPFSIFNSNAFVVECSRRSSGAGEWMEKKICGGEDYPDHRRWMALLMTMMEHRNGRRHFPLKKWKISPPGYPDIGCGWLVGWFSSWLAAWLDGLVVD